MAAYLLGNFKVTNAEEFEKYRDLVTEDDTRPRRGIRSCRYELSCRRGSF